MNLEIGQLYVASKAKALYYCNPVTMDSSTNLRQLKENGLLGVLIPSDYLMYLGKALWYLNPETSGEVYGHKFLQLRTNRVAWILNVDSIMYSFDGVAPPA